ncbi:lycopene beta-cyclase CrtY [Aurantiacibacter spongiae]|uniref:Lycopene cyclase n=1 Tax=Aurantiacibacter spongiae TaxID=2488860 RepID=A0A3N5CSQ1_9SPHN|nr:lycopene beta-cyclase CrtY [Aurantiacibacter spongiae]RPF72183.1 lycopene cyclase [Aurantiacibacter spongiae]
MTETATPPKRDCDIAIVGGGLSGGLIALALAWHRPELVVRLIEAGPRLGGNHRWSWFASDLDPAGTALMERFPAARWNDGYDVCFPDHSRTLRASYRSLASADFAATLERELSPGTILTGSEVAQIGGDGVTLRDGSHILARTVIDCRGFSPTGDLTGGWQVFMGRRLRTDKPHGMDRPIIMDATVDQVGPAGDDGAYRFVYALPLGEDELFVEDTYYADAPRLDRAVLSGRIDAWCGARAIAGQELGSETGVLPVIIGGDFDAYRRTVRIPGVAIAGARGGFVHPLTSYTLPIAVRIARVVAVNADLPGDKLARLLEAHARRHWRTTGFYRLLGAMLFGAAEPAERYRVFQRFYRLREPLIERFYAARSRITDKARVLIGRPPVSMWRAIRSLAARPSTPLAPDRKDIQ